MGVDCNEVDDSADGGGASSSLRGVSSGGREATGVSARLGEPRFGGERATYIELAILLNSRSKWTVDDKEYDRLRAFLIIEGKGFLNDISMLGGGERELGERYS